MEDDDRDTQAETKPTKPPDATGESEKDTEQGDSQVAEESDDELKPRKYGKVSKDPEADKMWYPREKKA